jgi:hypothetical protein
MLRPLQVFDWGKSRFDAAADTQRFGWAHYEING